MSNYNNYQKKENKLETRLYADSDKRSNINCIYIMMHKLSLN